MLKNISNNVKCVKVRYAKILLSSASLFALSIWIVVKTCKWGQFNSPILSKVPIFFKIPNKWTQHSSDHTLVANKKGDSQYQFFLSQWFSPVILYPSNLCPRSESRHEKKTIPQEKTGSYFMLLSQKVSRPTIKWPLPKEETLLHQSLG